MAQVTNITALPQVMTENNTGLTVLLISTSVIFLFAVLYIVRLVYVYVSLNIIFSKTEEREKELHKMYGDVQETEMSTKQIDHLDEYEE